MSVPEVELGRGDDTVGNPHRAQIYQFELFELKFFNSSFSSLSSRWNSTNGSLSSDSRQVERFEAAVSQSAVPSPPLRSRNWAGFPGITRWLRVIRVEDWFLKPVEVAGVVEGVIPVSVKKHSSGESYIWEYRLSEHQIRAWRAVSATGSQGKGLHKMSFLANISMCAHHPCVSVFVSFVSFVITPFALPLSAKGVVFSDTGRGQGGCDSPTRAATRYIYIYIYIYI